MRIVLAIRESGLRLALELLISQEPGVRVVGTASNVDGLLALVRTNAPDLVLLDWELPGKPVSVVLPGIKSLVGAPGIIVLCSNPDAKDAALEAGADDFLLKGDPPESVVAVLKKHNIRSST